MRIVTGDGGRDRLVEMALSSRYAMVLCYDIKTANIYKRAGVPADRVFTKSTVKDKSKGKMIAPPNYMIVDDADLIIGYLTGQPPGILGIPDAEIEVVE